MTKPDYHKLSKAELITTVKMRDERITYLEWLVKLAKEKESNQYQIRDFYHGGPDNKPTRKRSH